MIGPLREVVYQRFPQPMTRDEGGSAFQWSTPPETATVPLPKWLQRERFEKSSSRTGLTVYVVPPIVYVADREGDGPGEAAEAEDGERPGSGGPPVAAAASFWQLQRVGGG
jgi:hypothetical protein